MAAVKKSVSVKDVARLAGVSEQTVSRTVHDSPSVRPETKERVRAAMRELGYRPNFAGRSLRRGKFKTVGVAMFNITGTGNLDRMEDFGTFEPLPGMQTVLVTMLEHPLCSTVDNDQFDCSRQVVEYLLGQGHKTVHFISCPERSLSGMRREEGWRETLRAHGIELPQLVRGDWTAQSGYAAGQVLADDPTCTAIYASNDAMAYGCIRGLESRGKRVPEDISVVGVDDSLGDIVPDRHLTTVRFDNKRVGMWAVDKIAGAESVAPGVEHMLIPGALIEGDTVRDLR